MRWAEGTAPRARPEISRLAIHSAVAPVRLHCLVLAFVSLASFASFVSFSTQALAAPPTTTTTDGRQDRAREAVRRGFAAFARGDAKAALEEYKRAQELVPEANLPYRYAAEALAQLGRTEEAIASLEKYLSLKPDVSDAAGTRARIDELRGTLPSQVTLECSLPKIAVNVDGAAAEAYPCPAELRVAGGEHALTVRAEGKREVLLKITTSPGATVRFPLTLEDAPQQSATESHGSTTKPKGPPSARPLRAVAYVSLGVGAVALITALIVDLAFLGPAIDDFKSAAERGGPDASDARSRVQTLRTVGIIGYASAAALATTGGVLFLLSPSTSVRATAAPNGGAELRALVHF